MDLRKNPFKRSMNPLQKQWYRVLVARRVVYRVPHPSHDANAGSYEIVCRNRYKAAFQRYNRQFRHEIEQLIEMQPSAIDAMKVHRCFAITTLWPPLHSRHEINSTLTKLEKVLTTDERRRLNEILKYKK